MVQRHSLAKVLSPTNKYSSSARFRLSLGLLALSLLAAQVSHAQTPVERLTQGLTERVSFDIDRFSVVGDNPLGDAATRDLLQPYLGLDRGIDTIEEAADVFELALSSAGYSFYRVTIPPQELTDGVIELLIKRYQIGAVRVTGNKHHSDDNVLASLPVLRSGAAPSTKSIAKAVRVANQNPTKRVRVSLAPGEKADEINANLTVVDQAPTSATIWLNNTGTELSGDYRLGASIAHQNLFDKDHQASLTFITSPEGVDDVQQFALNYRMPLYKLGGRLNLTAVKSDIDSGTVEGVFDIAGKGEVLTAAYTHELDGIGRLNHGISVQMADKLFDNDVRFLGAPLLEDVRSRPLTLSYRASLTKTKASQWSGFVSYISNQSGGAFNNAQSYSLARTGASDDWSKLEFGVSLQYTASDWLYSAALRYSTTSDRLITGEQFAVGGADNLRGLNERELRGDEGLLINLQAWMPPISDTLRAIAFVDMGRVENNRAALGNEFDSEDVVSVGAMLNWNPSPKISASASYGYLVDGIDGASDPSSASQDGDGKLNFNVSYRF